jgi:hypothetical protein
MIEPVFGQITSTAESTDFNAEAEQQRARNGAWQPRRTTY